MNLPVGGRVSLVRDLSIIATSLCLGSEHALHGPRSILSFFLSPKCPSVLLPSSVFLPLSANQSIPFAGTSQSVFQFCPHERKRKDATTPRIIISERELASEQWNMGK